MSPVAAWLFAVIAAAVLVPVALIGPASSSAIGGQYCGEINVPDNSRDGKVYANNVRCPKARRIGKYSVGNGPKVKGWNCSASLGRCYQGNNYLGKRWVKVRY